MTKYKLTSTVAAMTSSSQNGVLSGSRSGWTIGREHRRFPGPRIARATQIEQRKSPLRDSPLVNGIRGLGPEIG
jgi:hypothetical protein